MSTPSPAIERLASRLVDAESRAGAADVGAAVRACETLRGPLTKLAGTAGFASLLSRALSLAKRSTHGLDRLRVGPDGTLGIIDPPPAPPRPPAANDSTADDAPRQDGDAPRQAGVALVAELLGLLVTLIGESLTLAVVREAWPDAPPGTTTLGTEVNS